MAAALLALMCSGRLVGGVAEPEPQRRASEHAGRNTSGSSSSGQDGSCTRVSHGKLYSGTAKIVLA